MRSPTSEFDGNSGSGITRQAPGGRRREGRAFESKERGLGAVGSPMARTRWEPTKGLRREASTRVATRAVHSMPPVLGYPIPAKMIRNHNQETHTGRIQHTALGTCRNATPRTPRHQGEAHHQIPRVCRQMLNGRTEAHIKRIPTRDNCMRTHANRDPQSLFSGRVHQDIRRQGIGSVQIQGRNALAIHPQTGPAITLVIRSLVVVFQWIHPEPHSSRGAHGTKKCRVGLPTCDPSVRPIRLSGAGTVHPRGGAPPGKPPGRCWFWFHSATPART
jgi:hypothetical protein